MAEHAAKVSIMSVLVLKKKRRNFKVHTFRLGIAISPIFLIISSAFFLSSHYPHHCNLNELNTL